MFYIYILHSTTSDLFYVGYTSDPKRRLEEHNTNLSNTYTSKYSPWQLKTCFECGTSEAMAIQMERFIKKQKSRRLIEQLINPNFNPAGALTQLVRVP